MDQLSNSQNNSTLNASYVYVISRQTDPDCHRWCISAILDKTDMTHQVPKVGGKCSGRLQLTQQRVTEMEVIPPGKSGMVLMMEQKQGANPPRHTAFTPANHTSQLQ